MSSTFYYKFGRIGSLSVELHVCRIYLTYSWCLVRAAEGPIDWNGKMCRVQKIAPLKLTTWHKCNLPTKKEKDPGWIFFLFWGKLSMQHFSVLCCSAVFCSREEGAENLGWPAGRHLSSITSELNYIWAQLNLSSWAKLILSASWLSVILKLASITKEERGGKALIHTFYDQSSLII